MGFYCWNANLAIKTSQSKYLNYFGKLSQFMVEFLLTRKAEFPDASIKVNQQLK